MKNTLTIRQKRDGRTTEQTSNGKRNNNETHTKTIKWTSHPIIVSVSWFLIQLNRYVLSVFTSIPYFGYIYIRAYIWVRGVAGERARARNFLRTNGSKSLKCHNVFDSLFIATSSSVDFETDNSFAVHFRHSRIQFGMKSLPGQKRERNIAHRKTSTNQSLRFTTESSTHSLWAWNQVSCMVHRNKIAYRSNSGSCFFYLLFQFICCFFSYSTDCFFSLVGILDSVWNYILFEMRMFTFSNNVHKSDSKGLQQSACILFLFPALIRTLKPKRPLKVHYSRPSERIEKEKTSNQKKIK